jgi:hypothetical protein
MHNSVPWFFWLFPLVFALHNTEEALFFPAWSKFLGKFHKPVGLFEFMFAIMALTSVSVVITILASLAGKQALPTYLFFALNLGLLVNAFCPHLLATIVQKQYCPGVFTGLLFVAPTTVYLLLYGFDHRYFVFPMFWYVAIPFGALLVGSIPMLFRIGRMFRRALATNNASWRSSEERPLT